MTLHRDTYIYILVCACMLRIPALHNPLIIATFIAGGKLSPTIVVIGDELSSSETSLSALFVILTFKTDM